MRWIVESQELGSCRGASQALGGVGKEDSESAREENRMQSSEVQSVYIAMWDGDIKWSGWNPETAEEG